jgi:histidine triad (HIT) family protein
MSDCLFCQIVAGTIPSTRVAESDRALAFNDISPHARVHVLIIPKAHIDSADHLDASNADVLAEMVLLAQKVADVTGVRNSGYRLVMNVGEDAKMSVPHLHLHVLGGQPLNGLLG